MGRPGAGPAITLSFLLVAIACAFAALCYAELASMIPIAGSAYTYSYAILGEIVAWIIGWDLILEYAVSNMSVAVGLLGVLAGSFESVRLPFSEAAFPPMVGRPIPGSSFNLPAPGDHGAHLDSGPRRAGERRRQHRDGGHQDRRDPGLRLGGRRVNTANWHPFVPNGFSGVLTGASIVFFTYIGFDSVSTAAEECKHPQRDLPFGIIATLIVCTILYVRVSLVLTGIAIGNSTMRPRS